MKGKMLSMVLCAAVVLGALVIPVMFRHQKAMWWKFSSHILHGCGTAGNPRKGNR